MAFPEKKGKVDACSTSSKTNGRSGIKNLLGPDFESDKLHPTKIMKTTGGERKNQEDIQDQEKNSKLHSVLLEIISNQKLRNSDENVKNKLCLEVKELLNLGADIYQRNENGNLHDPLATWSLP